MKRRATTKRFHLTTEVAADTINILLNVDEDIGEILALQLVKQTSSRTFVGLCRTRTALRVWANILSFQREI